MHFSRFTVTIYSTIDLRAKDRIQRDLLRNDRIVEREHIESLNWDSGKRVQGWRNSRHRIYIVR